MTYDPSAPKGAQWCTCGGAKTDPDCPVHVPAEWHDYARQYGADEAIQRAREAGGFGVGA
jgi:hypothetical protein